MTATLETGTQEATTLPQVDRSVAPKPRPNLGALPLENRVVTWGSLAAALAISWVVVNRLLPVHGLAWFIVVAAICNVILLAVGTAVIDKQNVAISDRVAQSVISTGAIIVFGTLISVVVFVFQRGWPALQHLSFLTDDLTGVGPNDALSKGGIFHAIVGSLIEITIGVAIALPLGVGTAVFMNEVGGRFAKIVRTVVEAMTALPSIVAGLFIYTVWILSLGSPKSGLAAGLAIAVMMLPIIARASDVVLRVVPGTLREASLGLGASRWATVWHVVLPTARPGLATALILGIARGIGETSPVLITSGVTSYTNWDPTNGVMMSMPLYIYTNARSGVPILVERAFGCAAVLLMLVLLLFIIARLLARPATSKAPLWRRIAHAVNSARPVRNPGTRLAEAATDTTESPLQNDEDHQ
jgi:phosphate transport system permease protein